MRFHMKFHRWVGEVPASAPADAKKLGADEAPVLEAAQHGDNVLSCSRVDINGYPVQRIAVATKAARAGKAAPKLTGFGYVFEELTGAWYQMGPGIELVPGRIATFDIPSVLEQKGLRTPIEFLLCVRGEGVLDGEYVFAMAPDVSNPGT